VPVNTGFLSFLSRTFSLKKGQMTVFCVLFATLLLHPAASTADYKNALKANASKKVFRVFLAVLINAI